MCVCVSNWLMLLIALLIDRVQPTAIDSSTCHGKRSSTPFEFNISIKARIKVEKINIIHLHRIAQNIQISIIYKIDLYFSNDFQLFALLFSLRAYFVIILQNCNWLCLSRKSLNTVTIIDKAVIFQFQLNSLYKQ